MGRVLAVDPGEKRVGLALSDPMKIIAAPYEIIPFRSAEDLAGRLKALIAAKDVDTVVIGLPLQEDGVCGPSCAPAQELAALLSGGSANVVLWDERYTTLMAESILRESGVKTKNMKDKKDKIAASLLLENYLTSL